MFRSYSNRQVIPLSTCFSFAMFFISSLHLIPRLQLGIYPALLKKNQCVRVTNTPSALNIFCLDRRLASPSEMSSIWNRTASMELVQIPAALATDQACLTLDTKATAQQLPLQSLTLNPSLCPE